MDLNHPGAGKGSGAGRFRVWALNLAAIAVGLLLCEAVLQVVAALSPAVAFRLRPYEFSFTVDGEPLTATRELTLDPVLGYRFSPNSGRFDRWGYRNPAVPPTCAVLALGDSMTFGHDVLANESWPAVLAQKGHFCAYNAGVGGYGPAEYQVVLEETLALRPKVVIVGLFLGNDMRDAFRATYLRKGAPFRQLRSADPAVVTEMARLEQHESLRERTLRLLGVPAQPLAPVPERGLRQYLKDHSKLYGLARELRRTLRGDAPTVAGEKNLDTFETSSRKPHRIAWSRDPRLRTVFAEPEIMAVPMNLDDPRISEGERITTVVLQSMRDRLAREGIKLVVLVLPTKESAYAEILDPEKDGLGPASRDLLVMEDRLRRKVTAALEGAGIAYVDALPALRESLAKGVMAFNASDDGHPNAAGHEAIARALLPVIASRLSDNPRDASPRAAAMGPGPK